MKNNDNLNINNPAALGAFLKGDVDNFLVAATQGGIEAQEKAGQMILVANSILPKDMLHGCTREQLERMGIVFGAPYDDLFINVTFPTGWSKQATDHSMWSKLLDDKGRERAGIFYKAAFYDRRAHISLTPRFSLNIFLYCDEQGNAQPDYDKHTHLATIIMDCEKEIYRVGVRKDDHDYKATEEAEKKGRAWLDEHYPDWKDATAYWD